MDVRTAVATNGGDWVKRFGEKWAAQIEQLRAQFSADIEKVETPPAAATDVPIITVHKERVVDILRFLKDGLGYNFLSDITATDEDGFDDEKRFRVVYNLFAHGEFCRIRVKVRVGEGESVPTAVGVWLGANWAEREVWDMFGVRFEGHPDLRRILMDERWEGHPLRKDYPLRGYQIFTEPMNAHEELLQ